MSCTPFHEQSAAGALRRPAPGFSRSSSLGKFALRVAATCALSLSALLFLPLFPDSAAAATWPLQDARLSASVAFHESYEFDGDVYTHHGIDIPGPAGDEVHAPLDGTVSFVGLVPAGDGTSENVDGDRRMRAVSLALADGRIATFMPCSRIDVSRGDSVAEGEVLATLAASGDRSSSETHLHFGLKRGSTYYDPMDLFGIAGAKHPEPTASAAGSPATASVQAAPVAAPGAQPVAETVSAGEVSESPVLEDARAASVTAGVRVPATSASTAAAKGLSGQAQSPAAGADGTDALETDIEQLAGTVSSGSGVSVTRGQESEPGIVAGLRARASTLVSAVERQGGSLVSVLRHAAMATGAPVFLLAAAGISVAVAVVAGIVALVVRRGVPLVASLWDTVKNRLYVRKGDGKIHGLFPASGTAFISRSLLARRR